MQYTVVQHSGYGYGRNPQFKAGLESREVNAKQAKAVEKVGGMVFPNYGSAEDFAEREMYGPDVVGLLPKAPGSFAGVSIDGLAVYVPKEA